MLVAIPSIQVGFFTRCFLHCNVLHGLASQSLLFRSVFSLFQRIAETVERINAVAIPSIQVGFFTRLQWQRIIVPTKTVAIPSIQVGFFTHGTGGRANVVPDDVAIPSIQVGFFTRRSRRGTCTGLCCRNPFYSGRFFHSPQRQGVSWPDPIASQSLLFRSVFSLRNHSSRRWKNAYRRNPFYSGRFFHSVFFQA